MESLIFKFPTGAHIRQLVGGVGWTALASVAERLIALAQSIYTARLLGAEQYGRFGLVFVTVGLVSALAGLQLGLTAAVHVSRYARTEPRRAGGIVRLCELVGVSSTLLALALMSLAPGWIATHLLGGKAYVGVLGLSAVIVLLSIVGGIQDGVLQGFERFRALAFARIGATAAGLAVLITLGRKNNLDSVLLAVVLASGLRTVTVIVMKEIQWRSAKLRASIADIWGARQALFHFSLPSVLASLMAGGVNWYALLLVSKVHDGFHGVAYLTTGQQWQGTVLFTTAFMASVAIPMMSRMLHGGDTEGARSVYRANLGLSMAATFAAVAVVCSCSQFILRAYGKDFGPGTLVFALMILGALPTVYINTMLQVLVSKNRMWQQLFWYAINYAPLLVGYLLVVPRYGAFGYAIVLLTVNTAFGLFLHFRVSGQIWTEPLTNKEVA